MTDEGTPCRWRAPVRCSPREVNACGSRFLSHSACRDDRDSRYHSGSELPRLTRDLQQPASFIAASCANLSRGSPGPCGRRSYDEEPLATRRRLVEPTADNRTSHEGVCAWRHDHLSALRFEAGRAAHVSRGGIDPPSEGAPSDRTVR